MKVLIKVFLPGAKQPRYVGQLELNAEIDVFDTQDLQCLWDMERAINDHPTSALGRCHVEIVRPDIG